MSECRLYLGGKEGTKIYFGKPVIHDENNAHFMFPNDARLRNMNYSMSIHYDVDIEFIDKLRPGEIPAILGGSIESKQEEEQSDEDILKKGGSPMPVKITRTEKEPMQFELDPQQAAELRKELEESIDGNIQRRFHTIKKVFLGHKKKGPRHAAPKQTFPLTKNGPPG